MSWLWYPKAWNGIADDHLAVAVGCTNEGCTERAACWARRFALRQKPYCRMKGSLPCFHNCVYWQAEILCKHYRGCQQCYEFAVHDHFERWDEFRPGRHKRFALALGGDLLNQERIDQTIIDHLDRAASYSYATFLIQTRHVVRILEFAQCFRCGCFQVGTSFTGPADLDNVRALAQLPENVVRFIAFEPFWGNALLHQEMIVAAKPNWAYIGDRTPKRKPDFVLTRNAAALGDWLNSIGCAVVYKKSCGPELYARNKEVVLP